MPARMHGWGRRNHAIFDKTKEEFVILDHVNIVGRKDAFRMPGTWIGGKLTKTANAAKILAKV